MFATHRQTESTQTPALSRIALRRRSSDHPMMMFSIAAAAAFFSMAFAPTSGPAFASFGPSGAPMKIDEIRTTQKADRLPMSDTDLACRGQAWGAESEACLATIVKDAGEVRKVRLLASAEPLTDTPNIF